MKRANFPFPAKTGLLAGAMLLAQALQGFAANDGLPDPGFDIVAGQTALVITDPQNDFLSPDGVAGGVVGPSVIANDTVANLDSLFATAKATDMPVFVSPHYYFPHDHEWKIEGTLEMLMH